MRSDRKAASGQVRPVPVTGGGGPSPRLRPRPEERGGLTVVVLSGVKPTGKESEIESTPQFFVLGGSKQEVGK
jgi:hypothetical protein